MMKKLLFFILLFPMLSYSQLGVTKSQAIDKYGFPDDIKYDHGETNYIWYERYVSEDSGVYTRMKIYVFRNDVCVKIGVVEPQTELKKWVELLDGFIYFGDFEWYNPAEEIHYKIKFIEETILVVLYL